VEEVALVEGLRMNKADDFEEFVKRWDSIVEEAREQLKRQGRLS